ncbi:MAG: glycosyltransferase family 9 protein [Thermoguttaceae bacterium]|jgi:lipopolysaccharide heptosyltransferase II
MPRRADSNDHAAHSLPRAPSALPTLTDPWLAVQRLLAIRLDNIGDIIMLSPALQTLGQALPKAELHLMASPTGSQAAPLLPWVDRAFVHRAIWQDISGSRTLNLAGQQELVETLRQEQFDAAIIFTSFSQSPYPPAYACYLAGIPVRIGQSREFGGEVLSHWIKPLADETHQVDRNLHLLEAVGIKPLGRQLELQVPEADRQAVDRLFREIGLADDEPFVALVPGASCASRRYAPARFAEVARRLPAEAGLRCVVLGSEKEAALVRPILETGHSAVLSLLGRTTVPMLADVVRRARLVVANNSAALHVADAFGRPSVILYSGTDLESHWRPRCAPSRLLRQPTACSPCHSFACPYHMECLDISPTVVVDAALALLAQTGENVVESLPRRER